MYKYIDAVILLLIVIFIPEKSNVNGISIGCNSGSAPPIVPKLFNWQDPVSDERMITMVHPNGYGGITLTDAVYISNWNEAIIFDFRGDNEGPPHFGEVLSNFQDIRFVTVY